MLCFMCLLGFTAFASLPIYERILAGRVLETSLCVRQIGSQQSRISVLQVHLTHSQTCWDLVQCRASILS